MLDEDLDAKSDQDDTAHKLRFLLPLGAYLCADGGTEEGKEKRGDPDKGES